MTAMEIRLMVVLDDQEIDTWVSRTVWGGYVNVLRIGSEMSHPPYSCCHKYKGSM